MAQAGSEIIRVNIEDEMRQSYLDYAMSVIVGRALPDVRDGLKPVHRRVLHAMRELGNDWNKPYKKSARVVGDVVGKYHPHGDAAVYDTLVRMAQPFSLRYMLVDGQGNFGSIDGDAPAAMRYTEVRLSRIAHELLADIDRDTVDFQPNYDESEREPVVLPARLPNLLVNGAAGIAVGMATNVPPHNLGEVVDALVALIDDPELSVDELMRWLPGPDFPTGGIVNGISGLVEAYRTGRGRIRVRARATIETEENGGREAIIVTELPYQVNKARLIERIAELVKEKKLEGIAELRDESDKDGMRIYIEIKRGERAAVVLNHLFQQTPMESVFGINMVALDRGQPRLFNLKELLEAYLAHRREVVTRRCLHDLAKARARAHLLEGLTVALANIDEVIELIRRSPSPAEARARLLARPWPPGPVTALLEAAGERTTRPEGLPPELGLHEDGYRLSEAQAKEILEMRLHRLTGLEQERLGEDYRGLIAEIRELIAVLEDPARLLAVIRGELLELKREFGDARRTEIQAAQEDLDDLDLIAAEDVVVTLSHLGYVKIQPVADYRAQRRGGRGRAAAAVKEEDFIERLWLVNTHDTLLCFSNRGQVYWLPVHRLPQAGTGARGRPIVNLLRLREGERLQAALPLRGFDEGGYVFFATRAGVVKKTPLSEFSRPRESGIRAILLEEGDGLVDVALTDGLRDVLLFSSGGKVARFHESEVRPMGRDAHGVLGMKLGEGESVVSMIVAGDEPDILTVTEHGFGKRSPLAEHPVHGRNTQGVIAIRCSARNGRLVGAVAVGEEDEIMLISSSGTLIRTPVSEVSRVGRITQGVALIRLDGGETVASVARIPSLGEEGDEAPLGARPEASPAA
ncbi:MAG: DNA gyrase subunit A [Xanthomonadales bacterium]|nr:DNA gyrase subunit A [Xanthomonadales bacterium]